MPNKTAAKKSLSYERKNGYERISAADLKKLEEVCRDYMAFLGASKTEREAHDEGVKLKIDGKYHYLCCGVCAKLYREKYDKLKKSA